MLSHARRIEFYGVGNSGIVAQDAQHKFFRFGISTVAYVDTHIQLMAASVLSDQDVLVVISNSGSSIEVLDAVQIHRQRNGARRRSPSPAPTSPLAPADCVLSVMPQETPSATRRW